jgi:hypothetical protein
MSSDNGLTLHKVLLGVFLEEKRRLGVGTIGDLTSRSSKGNENVHALDRGPRAAARR